MRARNDLGVGHCLGRLRNLLRRPEMHLFIPAVTLSAFWFGGEGFLILVALGVPLLLALSSAIRVVPEPTAEVDPLPDLAEPTALITALDGSLGDAPRSGRATGCIVILLDDFDQLGDRHGRGALARIMRATADRLRAVLRDADLLARIDGGFAIAIGPTRRMDLAVVIQLAARLQSALGMAISLDGTRVYVSASLGFCLDARSPEPTGAALYAAALVAAQEAATVGPGAIRAFTPGMEIRAADRSGLRATLIAALEGGQIRPHFQPQIAADTRRITGFEALARWHHPDRGVLMPADFLPLIEEAGLSERLSDVILTHALSALVAWQQAGIRVPSVGVNFSAADLRDPRFVDKLRWELDRYDLSPERLSVEVLETVVAETDDDIVVHNLVALSHLGCGIDLDDFGTGYAAIGNIRRFAVRRIKIDRSFVTRLDADDEQQKMVAAILSMARQLGLATLAEGVETEGELRVLDRLGCDDVQGYAVAQPMPFEETFDWMARHRSAQGVPLRIGARAG